MVNTCLEMMAATCTLTIDTSTWKVPVAAEQVGQDLRAVQVAEQVLLEREQVQLILTHQNQQPLLQHHLHLHLPLFQRWLE
uniref:Uncharacterized protein n=1 Tax=Anopheles merus TaxID=30066 RepID=A0A182VJ00_ANOME